jgi:hypothetical protein
MAQKEKGKDRITTKDVERAKKIIEARSKYQEDDAGEGYKGTPDMYPDYDIDFEEDFKKIDAEKIGRWRNSYVPNNLLKVLNLFKLRAENFKEYSKYCKNACQEGRKIICLKR